MKKTVNKMSHEEIEAAIADYYERGGVIHNLQSAITFSDLENEFEFDEPLLAYAKRPVNATIYDAWLYL